ncbi:MAG: DUF3990 domain-containing protein [Lachnospiraceae bacterium]|nr:DUF3990 domain-containing protein [Lachnospiraceae bacterium]
MRLYHTSKTEIRQPDIHRGRQNADFGPGFYLTPDREFACRWAGKDAVINIYEFDTDGLQIREFKRDLDWFRYIFSNRNAVDSVNADVVMGPIANDTIYDTLGILTSGLISDEDALSILLIGHEYIQVAVKTEKAAEQLRFIGSETNIDEKKYAELLKKEQEEFRNAFNEIIDRIAGDD